MSDLEGQLRKRPGNRDRIDRIKDEMDRDVLRTRIAAAIKMEHSELNFSLKENWDEKCLRLADAAIREMGLSVPCAATGCRVRQVAKQASKRHAESSSRLEYGDER